MNPSDAETSSTSSSSACPSEHSSYDTPSRQQYTARGEERSSTERARGASAPPSYLRESDSGDALVPGSQRQPPQGTGAETSDMVARKSTPSPPRRSSTTAPGRREDEEIAAQKPGTSSRQRPLSAPPKAYPFSRDLELPREHDSPGKAGYREKTTARVRKGDTGDVFPREAGRLQGGAEIKQRAALAGSVVESRTAQERLSLSSIFGAASERRASGGKRSNTGVSRSPEGNKRNANIGASQSDLREKGAEEGCGKADPPAVATLSSQDFGLHQWKEYAVLRHGNNRRFVNSQHGREILAETAAAIRTKEVEDLNRELKEMRALVEELHSALRAEQVEKSNLQAKVVSLEREVEGMDFVRRRWLREDASNRSRGSNLERRLAGNTGNLRTFLFGADAKPTTTRLAPPEASLSSTTGSIRPSVATSFTSCLHGGGGGGAAASERFLVGEEEDGDLARNTTTAEGNAVRRVRETAELERSELRRRHEVEMSAKQSRIEKLKLEVRKLEAERDGLKQAAESQAVLLKDGYAELKACLQEMKTHRPPPPTSSDMSPAAEVGRRLSLDTPSPRARHRSHGHPSELANVSDGVWKPAVTGRTGTARGRRVHKSDGWGTRDERGDASSGAGSEGSGTLWVRVMPTDENSSEEEDMRSPSPRSLPGCSTPSRWRGREEILRRYLGGADGGEPETPSGSRSRTRTAKAHAQRSVQTDQANSSGAAARGIAAAGGASGSGSCSPSQDSGSDGERPAPEEFEPGGRLNDRSDEKRPGIRHGNRRVGRLATELAAAQNSASVSSAIDPGVAAGAWPRSMLERDQGEGLERPRGTSSEEGRARAESGFG